ncbi:hypothetical protein CK503_06170 [Aliifodinibius salipaludis]|uniref:Uncharacterized protein n=1 Tax=Fodinibius salipaludis TaxID=2032627 RepID=A0A2A2GBM5_9BACT|nr:hypothetical protein [Aliifodinibius salipaludis]PAU94384.1 hypothetical protein CK503_06170 [Aliifodinibius salipaludis]
MYIIDHDKQVSLINEMKQLRKDSKKYEVYYHHPFTNQMWKSFFPLANEDELGPKLLRHEPVPTNINERLNICLGEDAPENAIGLGIEWSARPEIWPDVIQALENRYSHFDRHQLKLFLDNLHLDEAKEKMPAEVPEDDTRESKITEDKVGDLIWRSRKIRMKRFFVLG